MTRWQEKAANPTTHAELMREMRSPNGFDPMPPSQHEFLIDAGEPATNRAIAWVWSKTIRPGRGHSRSPFAKDERGNLRHTHAAIDLGWTISNTKSVFEKLKTQGRIRTDNEGRIWLCGDVPAPQRTKSEAKEKELCTYLPEPHLAQYLQGLDKNERSQRQTEWEQLQRYKRKLAAEALAAARALGEELELTWKNEIGYTPKKQPRGRPKQQRPAPILQLSLLTRPNFVHNSEANLEHNSTGNSEQKENGPEQNQHPYVSEAKSFRELAPANEAELEDEIRYRIEDAAHLQTVGGKQLDMRTIRTMRAQLQQLSTNTSVKEVLEVLEDKCQQLASRPNEADAKTWGWIVGLVKSETLQRLTTKPNDQIIATIKAAAAGKTIR